VGYRFGVLPVLIGDQLVELDLAYFRERRDTQADAGMRRMVMTFSTPSLGRIEVAAQALADRLNISIKTDSAASSEVLGRHASEVRDLLSRLGWNVDAVAYDFAPDPRRAASHIVDHVLQADSLSRLL
jgi:Flagellar hook-length control protein FliK